MQSVRKPWIKLKEHLDLEDCRMIGGLEKECAWEGIALKLELDYKLNVAGQEKPETVMQAVNELMYFDGERLIGYIGIGNFGGPGSPPELNGMVHPEYRRQGVFQTLSGIAIEACKRQGAKSILLLCDKQSAPGQKLMEKTGARYHHSEYEMYLRKEGAGRCAGLASGITFRKALNGDAYEVARQNVIYFGEKGSVRHDDAEDNSLPEAEKTALDQGLLMPEEEEKKGMTIYFALQGDQMIGKVHLQLAAGLGGIYGLGVLPEHRGKGFGRAILLGAVEKLKEVDAKEIMLQVDVDNANALRLYESCGFEVTSAMDYFELTL